MKKFRITKTTFNDGEVRYHLEVRSWYTFLGLPLPFWGWRKIKFGYSLGYKNWTDDYSKIEKEYDKALGNQIKTYEVVK
ncbi:hypothetical protein [Lactococcus garvieae]|uniref:Uncharacterized protein n=1 Tax=Lactococcus garvieae TaxID=1363 RepID=A0AAX3NFX2_9LACT|nr:hypothetical protein [Lactococcus garvieae]NHI70457.1 hypothetical protein [Lactococcus garvieae]NHJ06335.1 hypothetical protein [Lactococcus garvieae]WEA14841.1 hypothetical protein PWF74_04860 [Lactococcus garvieae]